MCFCVKLDPILNGMPSKAEWLELYATKEFKSYNVHMYFRNKCYYIKTACNNNLLFISTCMNGRNYKTGKNMFSKNTYKHYSLSGKVYPSFKSASAKR